MSVESPDLVFPPDDVLVHCGGVGGDPHTVLVPVGGGAALTWLLRCVKVKDLGPRLKLLDHRSSGFLVLDKSSSLVISPAQYSGGSSYTNTQLILFTLDDARGGVALMEDIFQT